MQYGITTTVDAPFDEALTATREALAEQAVAHEPSIGLLLPCNVVVRADGDARTVVEALDPDMMVGVTDNEHLQDVATDARTRLDTALASLPSRVS